MSPNHALIDIIDERINPPTMIHSDFTAIDLARSNVSKGLNDRSRYVWSKPAVLFPPSESNSCKKWGAKHLNTRFLVSTTSTIPADVMVGCPRITRGEVPFLTISFTGPILLDLSLLSLSRKYHRHRQFLSQLRHSS